MVPPPSSYTCSCAAAVDARTLRTLCARCDAILTTEKRMRPTESVMTAQATASRERMKRRITRHMDASARPTAHTSSLHSRSNLHTHTHARAPAAAAARFATQLAIYHTVRPETVKGCQVSALDWSTVKTDLYNK